MGNIHKVQELYLEYSLPSVIWIPVVLAFAWRKQAEIKSAARWS